MTPPLWQKGKKTKEPLDESEREEWKCWLKSQHSENEEHGTWSHHSWQIDGESVETWLTLFWGAPKSLQIVIRAMKLKDTYSLKESYDQLNILKSRNITLSTKAHLVRAMIFPVVMYGCETSTIKKAECWITDTFELWCWRRLLRVPWTARKSNQSILKEISPGCSLEGLMLKLNTLATWCEVLTHFKRPWCWERFKVGGKGNKRGWDGWMASSTQWTCVWVNSRSWWWTGRPSVLWFMGLKRVEHDWVTELNWQDLKNNRDA